VNGPIKLVAPLLAALAIAACNAGGSSNMPAAPGQSTAQTHTQSGMPEWQAKGLARPACPQVVGKPTCLALVQNATPGMAPDVSGWTPSNIQARYDLPSSTNGSGQIVGIVDAYDNPDVATDIAAYRSEFGLGTAKFYKYNESGQQSNYPSGSVGWGVEIALDVEMVSAACPLCTIYLIEANSSDSSDLQTAELEAVKLGAKIVSNSWICYGSNSCVDASDFSQKGILYLAASGDEGYDHNGNPESLASVVSVGGTVMSETSSKYSEVVWDDAGGGCSNNGSGTGVTKPTWQTDPDCKYRTDADVSAVAWNMAEYDTYGYPGWFTVGGTSVASPLTAAVFGLAGNSSSQNAGEGFWKAKKKKQKKDLHVITSGSDGSCGGEYLCEAGTGQFKTYAGPTGWGTPDGIKLY
jgi:subtilase family serine protease